MWEKEIAVLQNTMPEDLVHFEEFYPAALKTFRGEMGNLIFTANFKFGTPRESYLRAWKTFRRFGRVERMYKSCVKMLLAMNKIQNGLDTWVHDVGGPLHVHGHG